MRWNWSRIIHGYCFLAIIVVGFFSLHGLPANAAESSFTAPNLNVPIPGLNFADYPIVIQDGKAEIPFLAAYISSAYRYAVSIVAIVATVMFIAGAFTYLISAGGVSSVNTGKALMTDSIIGMLLVIGSYSILYVINPQLVSLNYTKLEQVNTVLQFIANAEGKYETRIQDDPAYVGGGASSSGGGGVASGAAISGKNQGCAGESKKYTMIAAKCATHKDCYQKYCVNKSDDIPEGVIMKADMGAGRVVSFSTLPKEKEQQIQEYGLYFSGHTYSSNNGMRAEAHAALLKAGQIAKSKGGFLYVMDIARTWEDHLEMYCQRMKSGSPGGMASPGSSPHQSGIAVDLSFYTPLKDGEKYPFSGNVLRQKIGGIEYVRRAGFPPLCDKNPSINHVKFQNLAGVQWLELQDQILAEAGFYRYCQESWHYDYGGIYPSLDCTKCAWPPDPPRDDAKPCLGDT